MVTLNQAGRLNAAAKTITQRPLRRTSEGRAQRLAWTLVCLTLDGQVLAYCRNLERMTDADVAKYGHGDNKVD